MFGNKSKYGVNLTHFTDSLINGSMKHFREVNRELANLRKDVNYNDLKYMGQFICRTKEEQPESDWKLMSEGGAEILVTGFESYSPRIRKHMGKNYSNQDSMYHLVHLVCLHLY